MARYLFQVLGVEQPLAKVGDAHSLGKKGLAVLDTRAHVAMNVLDQVSPTLGGDMMRAQRMAAVAVHLLLIEGT